MLNRGVSELISTMLLILIILAAMSFVLYYFGSRVPAAVSGMLMKEREIIQEGGQLLTVVYFYNSTTNPCQYNATFYIEDTSNLPVYVLAACMGNGSKELLPLSITNLGSTSSSRYYGTITFCDNKGQVDPIFINGNNYILLLPNIVYWAKVLINGKVVGNQLLFKSDGFYVEV
ncbi:hypothetical protein HS7_12800 [Sulfolobales archaeon HS-7]|nr:hypothetical protein HS7_12800 [Sulfolobales archaeon HS-7]